MRACGEKGGKHKKISALEGARKQLVFKKYTPPTACAVVIVRAVAIVHPIVPFPHDWYRPAYSRARMGSNTNFRRPPLPKRKERDFTGGGILPASGKKRRRPRRNPPQPPPRGGGGYSPSFRAVAVLWPILIPEKSHPISTVLVSMKFERLSFEIFRPCPHHIALITSA